jgi:hypothetical protein
MDDQKCSITHIPDYNCNIFTLICIIQRRGEDTPANVDQLQLPKVGPKDHNRLHGAFHKHHQLLSQTLPLSEVVCSKPELRLQLKQYPSLPAMHNPE